MVLYLLIVIIILLLFLIIYIGINIYRSEIMVMIDKLDQRNNYSQEEIINLELLNHRTEQERDKNHNFKTKIRKLKRIESKNYRYRKIELKGLTKINRNIDHLKEIEQNNLIKLSQQINQINHRIDQLSNNVNTKDVTFLDQFYNTTKTYQLDNLLGNIVGAIYRISSINP